MKTVVFRLFSEGRLYESLPSPELAFTTTTGNLAIISRHQSIDSQALRRIPGREGEGAEELGGQPRMDMILSPPPL